MSPEQTNPYEDMLLLPRHVSPTRRPMPQKDRAAQFAPFAALSGYEEIIREAARLTDVFTEPSEEEKLRLNDQLLRLQTVLSRQPQVTVTWFREDERKSGGQYETVQGRVLRVDQQTRTLHLLCGTVSPIHLIRSLQSDDPALADNE